MWLLEVVVHLFLELLEDFSEALPVVTERSIPSLYKDNEVVVLDVVLHHYRDISARLHGEHCQAHHAIHHLCEA